jgi:predicted phage tail protein
MINMNIRGAGGGGSSKSGSSGGVAENPNTLTSVATVELVEAISVGEIVGLVNNEYSIYLDGVPLRDTSGTPNYKPFQWASRTGTQSQTVINGFAGTQQLTDVSTKVTISAGALIRAIPDQYASAVRVTVTFPSLTSTTAKGEIQGTTVQYKVGVRKVGGTFTYAPIQTVSGKSSGEYQDSLEVSLSDLGPSASGYEVTVVRITADSASALLQNDLYWSDYVVVHYEKFSYPNTALIALAIDSRYFSNVPARSYHVKGRLIRVPKNYDPAARIYATTGVGTTAGTWDGTFKWAYSNNPAWVYHDMLTSTLFGLGQRLSVDTNGYSSLIDRYALYVIGQYCDGMVPSGVGTAISGNTVLGREIAGGFSFLGKPVATVGVPNQVAEPRFTFNGVFNTSQDAYKVLQQLSAAFRGMTYWAQSLVMSTQDAPASTDFIVNNANVKNGKFTYQGSSRAQRRTVVTVGWNDPTENFKQKFEYVQDVTAVKQWGVRQTDIVLFGCTSRGQARRAGLWLLYTDKYETDQVVFTAGMDMSYVLPGMIGEVTDRAKAGVRWGGRTLAGSTTTTLVMDTPLTLNADSYTLKVKMPDGSLAQSQVTIATTGSYSSLALLTATPSAPLTGAIWALSSNTLSSRMVRCIARTMDGPDSFTFVCVTHNPSKYGAIENGLALEDYSYSVLNTTVVSAVTNVVAAENSYKPAVDQPTRVTALVSWDKVTDPLQQGYMVEIVSYSSGAYDYKSGLITDNFFAFNDIGVDTYRVTVVAVNQLGKQGPVTQTTMVVTGIDLTPPADVTGFGYTQDNLVGTTLKWNIVNDFISAYEIRVGATWLGSPVVWSGLADRAVLGPIGAGTTVYWIAAIDTSGNYSANPTPLNVVTAVPTAPGITPAIVGDSITLTWSPPSSVFGIDHYVVKYGTSYAAGTVINARLSAATIKILVDFGGARTFWVAAIDPVGNVGTPGRADVTIALPGDVQGRRADVIDNNALLYWTPPLTGSLPIDRYEVRKGATWAGGTVVGSNGNSTFAGLFEQQSGTYTYWVSAVDSAGNYGSASSIVATINQPPDYVLRVNVDSTFSGTLVSMIPAATGGGLLGPVNTTETFASHFTSHSWSTPQDQITAGFPNYLNPSPTTASYTELIDYGTALSASTIVVTPAFVVLQGTVTYTIQIQVKLNVGDAWTSAPVGSSYLATNFRYVNIIINFAASAGANLAQLTGLNIKLSSKRVTDGGSGVITTASTGVVVNFTRAFVSADTPRVQPDGLTPLLGVVDYTAIPNPTSFTVYLFNQAGTKVTGSFSWQASGFSS